MKSRKALPLVRGFPLSTASQVLVQYPRLRSLKEYPRLAGNGQSGDTRPLNLIEFPEREWYIERFIQSLKSGAAKHYVDLISKSIPSGMSKAP